MVRVASRVVIRVNLARVAHRHGHRRERVARAAVDLLHQVARRLLNGEQLTVRMIRMITSHTIPPSPSHHIPSLISQLTPSLHIASQAIVKIHIPSRHTLSRRIPNHLILSHRIPSHHILRIHTIPRMQGGANRNGDHHPRARHGLREVASRARAVVEDLRARHGAVERQERYEGI